MTTLNELAVKKEIMLKLSDTPYKYHQTSVITQEGRAYFPYPDWFRGEYMSDLPIVVEREAGFRPRLDRIPGYWKGTTGHAYPQHCFRASAKTRYPCYPECHRHDPTLMHANKIYIFR